MRHIIPRLLHILIPHHCLFCARRGHLLCAECEPKLPWKQSSCIQCGIPLTNAKRCGQCLKKPPPIDLSLYAWRYVAPISTWIKAYKFNQALYLTPLFIHLLRQHIEPPTFDAIIAVPLSKKRLRERGYNQAQLLAKAFAKHYHKPLITRGIKRKKHTAAQSSLPRHLRLENVRNAFECKLSLKHQRILLIDDVITTGSTVNALAHCLKKSGAEKIIVLALAHAD